jgi:hypothetical protein
MSGESERTHLPVKGSRLEPRGYYLGIAFHPPIRLERKRGYEFAAALADFVDPSNVTVEDHAWVFSQPIPGSPRSQLTVSVAKSQLKIDAEFPRQAKEWFEDRQTAILRKFVELFAPTLILQSAAMIRGVLPIDGDARTYLAQRVMNVRGEYFAPFGRPIHMIGLTLGFPPCRVESPDGARVEDSLVQVKVESLVEDTSKLFLEASGEWPQPLKCSDEALDKVVRRQDEVAAYLEKRVTEFLMRAAQGDSEAG